MKDPGISEEISGLIQEVEGLRSDLKSAGGSERSDFMSMLVKNGYGSETLVTDTDSLARITTERRMELIKELSENEFSSVEELADKLGRDSGNVSRDLDILFEEDVIDFEPDNSRKKPVLKRKILLSEPVFLG